VALEVKDNLNLLFFFVNIKLKGLLFDFSQLNLKGFPIEKFYLCED
jgi:hypothetical protein